MEILELEQVRVSKHLLFMKERGLVEAERHAQWMIYRISEAANPLLEENLKCLQDCAAEELEFKKDLEARKALLARLELEAGSCMPAVIAACC